MRSLRRAPHQRFARPGGATSLQAEELGTIKRRERIGLLRVLTLGAFLLGVAAFLAWSAHGRIVAQGLVEANLVAVRAPGRVRVQEVLCAPGQHVRRGDPLFVLEALESGGERRALELEIERARLRLALVESGGDLGEGVLDRRIAEVEHAEREWKLAEAALAVAVADREALRRRRATVVAGSEREVRRYAGQAEGREERALEAEALAGRAEAELRLAEYDRRSREALSSLGAVSERDRRVAAVALETYAQEVEAHRASSRALRAEAQGLRAVGALEERTALSELDEIEAALDSATAALEALRVRRDLWRSATLRRRTLGADGSGGTGGLARLRELELELLRKELEAGETRLEAFDRRVGNGVVRAEADGVCDQLLVRAGTVVAAGELLATHYDPRTRRIVAYVGPGAAEELALGQLCSVTPLRGDESAWGRVASSAAAWVPRPAALPGSEQPSADRRLSFQVVLAEVPENYRPGMRVTVVFERSPARSPLAEGGAARAAVAGPGAGNQ